MTSSADAPVRPRRYGARRWRESSSRPDRARPRAVPRPTPRRPADEPGSAPPRFRRPRRRWRPCAAGTRGTPKATARPAQARKYVAERRGRTRRRGPRSGAANNDCASRSRSRRRSRPRFAAPAKCRQRATHPGRDVRAARPATRRRTTSGPRPRGRGPRLRARPKDARAHERAANALVKVRAATCTKPRRLAKRACKLEPGTPTSRHPRERLLRGGPLLNARRELETAAQLAPQDDTIQAMLKRRRGSRRTLGSSRRGPKGDGRGWRR